MNEHENLQKARDLISAKNYDKARAILEKMPQNQTAQKWLAKLDEIAPVIQKSNRTASQKTPSRSSSWILLFIILVMSALVVGAFFAGRASVDTSNNYVAEASLESSKTTLPATETSTPTPNPPTATLNSCDIENWWANSGIKIVTFLDQRDVADTTARVALSTVILEMQKTYRDFQSLVHPNCLMVTVQLFELAMENTIEYLQKFQSENDVESLIYLNEALLNFRSANGGLIEAGFRNADARLGMPFTSIFKQPISIDNAQEIQFLGTMFGHLDTVEDLVFSPDGSILVSTAGFILDNSIRLWDVATGGQTATFANFDGNLASDIAFSSDGSKFAYSSGGVIHIVNLETGESIADWNSGIDFIHGLSFTPDGSKVAISGESFSNSAGIALKIWNVADNRVTDLGDANANRNGEIGYNIAFSPNGDLLSVGHETGIVTLWDTNTGRFVSQLNPSSPSQGLNISPYSNSVNGLSFSTDGTLLAVASGDTNIYVWNIVEKTRVHILSGHSESVTAVTFSSDGSLLASGSEDNTVRIWDTKNGQELDTLQHGDTVHAIAFSPDMTLLASAGGLGSFYEEYGDGDYTIKLWCIPSAEDLSNNQTAFSIKN